MTELLVLGGERVAAVVTILILTDARPATI